MKKVAFIVTLFFLSVSPAHAAVKVYTGTYTGNGSDDRSITGIGFSPKVVFIKGNDAIGSASGQMGIQYSTTNVMSFYSADNSTDNNNSIQAMEADGFQVGSGSEVNANSTVFNFVAIGGDDAEVKIGSYAGNSTDSRSITGIGFTPSFVLLKGTNNDFPVFKFGAQTGDDSFQNGLYGTGAVNHIQAFEADGFQVGTDNAVNLSGSTYYYVAIKDTAGSIKSASYTGNNTDNRSITGVGFTPSFVLLTSSSTGTRNGVMRTASHVGDLTSYLSSQAVDVANAIQQLISDGFEVGTDTKVNGNAKTYHYLAVANPAVASGGDGPKVTWFE